MMYAMIVENDMEFRGSMVRRGQCVYVSKHTRTAYLSSGKASDAPKSGSAKNNAIVDRFRSLYGRKRLAEAKLLSKSILDKVCHTWPDIDDAVHAKFKKRFMASVEDGPVKRRKKKVASGAIKEEYE